MIRLSFRVTRGWHFCVPLLLTAGACSNQADRNGIRASGHIEATEVRVAAKVGGRLSAVAVVEGATVRQGETIAQIDPTDLDLQIKQAVADRATAAAELQLRLAGARREDIAEMQAQQHNVAADLEGAQRELDRMQGLLDRGSGSVKARDDAQTRRDMATARLAAVGESLRRLTNGSRPEEIQAARARVAAVEARIAQLEQQRSDATITSPVAGTVIEKLVEAGEIVAPGTPLCVIDDLTAPWLTVYLGEPDLARVKLGQEVDVRTDDGRDWKGKITFIASRAEFTPKNVQTRDERVKLVFKIKVGLDNAAGVFKPGMPAEARITPQQGA